jgi:hypothetical protein
VIGHDLKWSDMMPKDGLGDAGETGTRKFDKFGNEKKVDNFL